MRPDGLRSRAFCFIVAGIVEQDHVYVTVVVGIVIVNVDLVLEELVCLKDGLVYRTAGTVIIVVMGRAPGKGDRAINIKLRSVLAFGIVYVIIPYGTNCIIEAVSGLVQHGVKAGPWIINYKS